MAKPVGSRCNMRCAYCYYVGKDEGDFAATAETRDSPRETRDSPHETADSPRETGDSPRETRDSPRETGDSPHETGDSPHETRDSPHETRDSPHVRRGHRPGRFSDALLESYISQRFSASSGPVVHFEWHGGEPTLLGLDWFKHLVRVQRQHCPPGLRFTNGLQTNGLLLNEAWASFLGHEGFSIGLSLDGPADCHDANRRSVDGKPTHERVLRSFRILRDAGIFTNVLCVVSAANVRRPEEVYRFFREIGAVRLQFLPLVTPSMGDSPHPLAAGREELGDFLCRIFDLWIAEDVGRIIVQTFDEALRPIHGTPHALCIHRETCGNVAVLETDGGFYACDHFVDPGHRLGTVPENDLGFLAATPAMRAFGEAKRGLSPYCLSCEVLSSCNGGCPKDRISPAPDGHGSVAWFCPSWKRFFNHARTGLEAISAHLKSGQSLRDFNQTASNSSSH